jgi:hypothetical protein
MLVIANDYHCLGSVNADVRFIVAWCFIAEQTNTVVPNARSVLGFQVERNAAQRTLNVNLWIDAQLDG